VSTFSRSESIVLVVDHRGLAFDNVATALKAGLPVEIVYWNDYFSIRRIVNALSFAHPKIIHFFWRDHLRLFLEELIRADALALFKDTHFTFSIPDHLRQDLSSLKQFAILPLRATSFVVTNDSLLNLYKEIGIFGSPWGVIHDSSKNSRVEIPIMKNFNGKLRALWVGNSQWGKSLGTPDHKGLQNVIRVALDEDFQARHSVELIVCDSSKSKFSQKDLRDLYVSSHFILQASISEGTGLPLLEGMAHGCVPITTSVGVVPELFSENLKSLCIINRSYIELRSKLELLIENRGLLFSLSAESQACTQSFFSEYPESRWLKFFNFVERSELPSSHLLSHSPSPHVIEKTFSIRRYPKVLDMIKQIFRLPYALRNYWNLFR